MTMRRLAGLMLALAALMLAPTQALAEPADIDAAARGVVRIVIVENAGGEVVPISHGTGFAVSPEQVVTNAHVIAEARADDIVCIAGKGHEQGQIVGRGDAMRVIPFDDVTVAREEAA